MKKLLAIILSIVMAISMLPFTAFAYDGTVKDIDLVRNTNTDVYFEVDGYWTTDTEGERYFNYSGFIGQGTGDVFTITDNDDVEHYYVCKYIDDEYIMCEAEYDEEEAEYNFIEDGDSFNYDEIQMIDEQDQPGKHFTLGDDNYYTIEYKGVRKDIPVSVVVNPVDAINFIPVSPVKIVENTGGEWRLDPYNNDEQFYYYEPPQFKAGDVLEVTFKGDENPTVYTYRNDNEYDGFYNSEDEELEGSIYTSRYSYERWTIEDGGEYRIIYSGRESAVKVEIIENTVTAIDYQRSGKDEYIEGDTRYDPYDNAYYYEHPYFREGDILTVYEGETATKYFCRRDEETWRYFFETEEGDKRIECDPKSGVSIDDNQRENSWTIGGENNEFYISYMGYTKTLYATIKENPVASITYTRAEPDKYIFEQDGWEDDGIFMYWLRMADEGDILSVTDKKGKTTSYTCTWNDEEDCREFVAESGEVIPEKDVDIYSDQRNHPWTIGSNNEITVTYSGCKYTIYATVEEDPVASIEYQRAEPAEYFENTNGWENDGIWRYEEPYFLEGDTITVYFTNGTSRTYTYRYYEGIGYTTFAASESEELDGVRRESNQEETPWTIGGDNIYYVSYHGKKSAPQKVTIKKNTVTGIDIVKAKPIVLFEGDTRERYSPMRDEMIDAYEVPYFENGDKLIVHDSEKGDIEYVYTFNEADGEWYFKNGDELIDRREIYVYDNQEYTPWEKDGENNFYTVEYLGKTAKVYVSIIESGVLSIEYTVANPERLILLEENEQNGRWQENQGEPFFFYDNFSKGYVDDTLTVNYSDGTSSVFTVKFDGAPGGTGVYLENDKGERISQEEVTFNDNQWDEPWFVDEECFYTVKYKGASFDIPVTIVHDYEKEVVAPTCTKEGCTRYTCKACGEEYEEDHKDALGHKSDKGTVTTKPTYTKEGVKTYKCERCGKTLKKEKIAKLEKKANPIKASGKTVNLKLKDVKSKAQTIKKSKAYSISKAKGTVTFAKSSGNKAITVDKKTGSIKVKKGLKKGTYKVKIKVKAAGTTEYKAKTVTVTVKVVIK